MVDDKKHPLPGNGLNDLGSEISPSSSTEVKEEKEFLNQLDFKNEQDRYWTDEQEKAVEQYLRMSESWLSNKIKWEHVKVEKKMAEKLRINPNWEGSIEPNWDVISVFEELIIESKTPEVQIERERIFRKKIEKPLNKLVENIVFSYKLFRGDIDVKSLQWDCLGFIIEKFANFKPEKGKKSFSYYGTVAKHYLIGEKKDNYKTQTSNLEYESFREEVNNLKKYELGEPDLLEESSKLFNYIISDIKGELRGTSMSDNDKNVGNAIVEILEKHEVNGVYTKNNLYQLIKEYTNLQTKDITYSLSRFKTRYIIAKQNFIQKNDV